MSSFGYDTYEADPGRLRGGIEEIKAISAFAGTINDTFVSLSNGSRGWYGVNDKYAEQVGPEWEKTLEGVTQTFAALRDAVVGVVGGRLQELESITGAQGTALEGVSELQALTDSVGTDGYDSGYESGDGKH